MRIALDNLPTDVSVLHQLVRDMAGALDESEIEAERLRLIIRQFQRASFGRRSEQLDPDQMAFGLEDLEADLARAEARKPPPASGEPSKPRTAPHRSPLPPHLPRVEDVRPVPHDVFTGQHAEANELRLQLDPDRMSLRLNVNGMGDPFDLETVQLDTELARQDPTPYGQLLLAVVAGDTRLSAHAEEAEEGWRIVQPILDAWAAGATPLVDYAAGSAGPERPRG